MNWNDDESQKFIDETTDIFAERIKALVKLYEEEQRRLHPEKYINKDFKEDIKTILNE